MPDFLGPDATPETGSPAGGLSRIAGSLALRAESAHQLAVLTATELMARAATRGKFNGTTAEIGRRHVTATMLGAAGLAAATVATTGYVPQPPQSINNLANYLGDTGLMNDPKLHIHNTADATTEGSTEADTPDNQPEAQHDAQHELLESATYPS